MAVGLAVRAVGIVPLDEIGEFVGQRNLATTANTYSNLLLDEAEVDYADLLRVR